MSANTLAIVLAVGGALVGFATSWLFTRSTLRDAEAKSARQLKEILTLRGVLSDVAESVAKPITPDVERALESARLTDQVAKAVTTSLTSATSASAHDVLVRASLGALLNEHGEVSVPRLLRAVTQGLPDATASSISSSLEELRKAGKVSWSGDDVIKAGVVRVNPQ